MPARTSLSAVGRIAAMNDPVSRNYQITRSYYELSQWMTTRTGSCATWCTFATWASRQAGRTIRKEDLLGALENHLADVPALSQAIYDIAGDLLRQGAKLDKKAIGNLLWEIADPQAAMSRASEAVARGNQKVYAEIAREFARFLDTCGSDRAFDAEKIARFGMALKPGDPPDGQRYLKQAFERYYRAFFEPDQKKKAESVLLANIEIGFHEQTRLQPEIAEALEAALENPDRIKSKLLRTLFPNQYWLLAIGSAFRSLFNRPTPLDIAIAKFTTEARRRIRLFLSAHLMELDFPHGKRLQLGKDLKAGFPPDLQQLTDPDLIDLLKKIDPTPDSMKDTGAVDWANLADRLHFIADMFRAYQENADMLLPPFDSEI